MNDNSNNKMSQQTMPPQSQWFPQMNPYGYYGMNQYGFGGFGAPTPFFPPGGFYPSQMPNHMINQQGMGVQMKGFVSGGKLETTTNATNVKKEDTNPSDGNKGETSAAKTEGENSSKPAGDDSNKMDIDLPPLPPGPAPPPFANFPRPPLLPGPPPGPGFGPPPMMNGSPMRFNMNFNKNKFNNNHQNQQQQQQQQMNFGVKMQGLSKKQRQKLRKRLAAKANELANQNAPNSPSLAGPNRFQPPLPPGPPPPPGSAPPPPGTGGSNNGQGMAQPFPPPEAKQSNYKNILNSSLMGDWPDSLRSYISRALERCKTESDEQRVTKQLQNKITAAVNSNMLYIKDWNVEPLPLMENELSNVTIKPFQFNNKTNNLSAQSPFQKQPNSSLKQRLGAMNSGANQTRSPYNKNEKNKNNQARNSDRYGRKRKSSSSSSSSTPGSESESTASDYIPLSNKNKNKKSKYNENSRSKRKSRNSKRCSESNENFSNVETDEALLKKRAARFESSARKSFSNFNVNFDSFDLIGRGGMGGEEEFDLDSCHVVGTSTQVEKQFFRLTAAPEPSMVRPPEILEKSLAHVKQKWEQTKDIVYATSQLKSIRQDLTVQGIRDQLTVKVYETHARIALETKQHAEFNQCQNQLRLLYSELSPEQVQNRLEFTAYRILYYIFTKDTMDLTMTLASLSSLDKEDPTIRFALSVQSAWCLGNYHQLFSLYRRAPLSSAHVMDLFLERERKQATARLLKAYRPTLPLDFLVKTLAFSDIDATDSARQFLVALGVKFSDADQSTINCKDSCPVVAAAVNSGAAAT
ncbi:hypothetical protein M8J76_009636 [Diaphorina citri]|nr:hypothetical protein M8J76_009636 [Diaphorina citri]